MGAVRGADLRTFRTCPLSGGGGDSLTPVPDR